MTREDFLQYYLQGSDHYLIPKNIFDELFTEMGNWKKESQKQKDVIDKSIEHIEDFLRFNCGMNCADMNSLLNILKEVE